MMNKNTKKGFTLIELLVVVLIIGVLAGIATLSLFNAQQKGRDARRKADLSEIYKAAVSYSIVNQGGYPNTDIPAVIDGGHNTSFAVCSIPEGDYNENGNWINIEAQMKTYLSGGKLPLDPLDGCIKKDDALHRYVYLSNAWVNFAQRTSLYSYALPPTMFTIWTVLENPKDPDTNNAAGDDLDPVAEATGTATGKYKDTLYYKGATGRAFQVWYNNGRSIKILNQLYAVGTVN